MLRNSKLMCAGLALLLLHSLPALSQSYYPAEEIDPLLDKLEQNLTTQSEQVKTLQQQLQTASDLLKKSENEKLKSNIKIGCICFSLGTVTGATIMAIMLSR